MAFCDCTLSQNNGVKSNQTSSLGVFFDGLDFVYKSLVVQAWQHYGGGVNVAAGVAAPYGTDPNYMCMPSHSEARDPASRQRTSTVSRNLDEEMEDLLIKLNEPSITSCMSPHTEQRTLQDEISKLTELQRRLQALKLRNSQGDRPATAMRKL